MSTRLIHGAFQSALRKIEKVKMVFADPPDNIGLKYASYSDSVSMASYEELLWEILWMSCDKCDIMWVSFNAVHLPLMGKLVDNFLERNQSWRFKPGVQIFTFGQHNHHDLGNNHRPLWRLMRNDAEIYPDAVRVPSWRLLNGDKRADPRGKVPGDVFDFPRVVGNSKQRRDWHPTQLNEDLYERCVKLSCTPDDTVCDIFAGTGTLARVCEKTGNPCILIEVDKNYCDKIALEHGLHIEESI